MGLNGAALVQVHIMGDLRGHRQARAEVHQFDGPAAYMRLTSVLFAITVQVVPFLPVDGAASWRLAVAEVYAFHFVVSPYGKGVKARWQWEGHDPPRLLHLVHLVVARLHVEPETSPAQVGGR